MTFVSSLGSSILLSLPLPFVAAIPLVFVCNCVCLYLSLPFVRFFPMYLSAFIGLEHFVLRFGPGCLFNACPFCLLFVFFSVSGMGNLISAETATYPSHLRESHMGKIIVAGSPERNSSSSSSHFVWHLMSMKGISYSGNSTVRIGWIYLFREIGMPLITSFCLFLLVFYIAVLLFLPCFFGYFSIYSALVAIRSSFFSKGSSRCGSSPTCLSFDISFFLPFFFHTSLS